MMDYETISLILQAGQLAVGIAALIAVLTRKKVVGGRKATRLLQNVATKGRPINDP